MRSMNADKGEEEHDDHDESDQIDDAVHVVASLRIRVSIPASASEHRARHKSSGLRNI